MTKEYCVAENYYNKAIESAANSDISKAIYYYTESIYFNYQVEESYIARAELFFQESKFKNALSDYNYLLSINSKDDFYHKIAICYEKLGDLSKSLEYYLMSLLKDINIDSYESIYRLAQAHNELRKEINFTKINLLINTYVDEEKALKFKESASEFDLDQRNDFLELYISLLPNDSEYLYDAHIQKAKSEAFRYQICFDKNFREELKAQHKITENELNNLYKYNAKNISELNLVYAVQNFNEATRFAKNVNEVNFLDYEVKKLISIAEHKY